MERIKSVIVGCVKHISKVAKPAVGAAGAYGAVHLGLDPEIAKEVAVSVYVALVVKG